MSNSADDANTETSTEGGDEEVLDLTEEISGGAEPVESETLDEASEEARVSEGEPPADEEELRETIQTSREELDEVEEIESSDDVPSAALVTPSEPVEPDEVGGEDPPPESGGGVDTVEAEPLDRERLEGEPFGREDDFPGRASAGMTDPMGEEPIEPDPLDAGDLDAEARMPAATEVDAEADEPDDVGGEAEGGEDRDVGSSRELPTDASGESTVVDEGSGEEPGGEMDEEILETVKMEAIDRTALEREGQVRQLEQTLPLLSSRFAPSIVVAPPRDLVGTWHAVSRDPPEQEPGRPEASEGRAAASGSREQPAEHHAETETEEDEHQIGREPPDTIPGGREPLSGDEGADPDRPDSGSSQPPPTKPPSADSSGSRESSSDPATDDTPPAHPPSTPSEADERGRSETPSSAPAQEAGGTASEVSGEVEQPAHKRETAPGFGDGEQSESQSDAAPRAEAPTPPPQRDEGGPEERKDEELSEIVEELVEGGAGEQEQGIRQTSKQPRGDWVKKVFGELFLATVPGTIERRTGKEADFIEASLDLGEEDKILDLACGYGRHTIELAGRGYDVVGFDLSKPLLKKALTAAKRKSLDVNFFHGDMRSLEFENVFDAAFCWQSSFGYFEDRTNADILARLNRSLKPGGEVLIDIMNRDYVVRKMPHRIWWEGRDCIFLEEGEFDFDSSVLHMNRSYIYESGRPPIEQDWYIRLYSRHEIIRLLEKTGFEVTEISGAIHYRGYFIGRDSPQLIVRAKKTESLGGD